MHIYRDMNETFGQKLANSVTTGALRVTRGLGEGCRVRSIRKRSLLPYVAAISKDKVICGASSFPRWGIPLHGVLGHDSGTISEPPPGWYVSCSSESIVVAPLARSALPTVGEKAQHRGLSSSVPELQTNNSDLFSRCGQNTKTT